MKKVFILSLIAILLGTMIACVQPVASETLKSEKPRITSPNVNKSDLSTLVDGNSAFAFSLYQALKDTEGNLFYSPYSISLALAMTYAGARGETEQQMANTLHFSLPQNQLHSAFNSLDIELAKRGEGAKGKDGEGFRLNIVNAIWGQKGFEFLPEFLDTLSENYGAGLRLVDFIKAPEESRIKINKWVGEQTEDRIKDLIPPDAINHLTRLVLTNAIYFNAAWLHPFTEDATKNEDFNLLNGDKVNVPMMKQTERLGYAEGNGYQAAELPYDGNEISMVILLPQAGQFQKFESSFDDKKVTDIVKDLNHRQVALTMPKFEFDSSFNLNQTLSQIGMPVAFSENADFSGMTGNRSLFISDVIHKAFVSVDEAGTEAAAATAVIMSLTAMPVEPIEVMVDRPFIFLIRDIETGTILFVGRILNPNP